MDFADKPPPVGLPHWSDVWKPEAVRKISPFARLPIVAAEWPQPATEQKEERRGPVLLVAKHRSGEASLADGDTEEQILQGFPTLKAGHIRAAVALAAESAVDQLP